MEKLGDTKQRVRAIPRERLPEHRIQIKTWTVKGKTFKIPNMWYDLDNKEFLTYNQRYGLCVVKTLEFGYTHSVSVKDVDGKPHIASIKKIIEQNSN